MKYFKGSRRLLERAGIIHRSEKLLTEQDEEGGGGGRARRRVVAGRDDAGERRVARGACE